MLTLIIDSCTYRGMVALVKDNHVEYMAGLPLGLHNSRYLLPKIEEGFNYLGKRAKDLDLIAVTNGPGSYTGIRAGVVVAKSFSYANRTPLAGVCSLEGFVPDHEGSFAAILDAKMAGCYCLKGAKKNGRITYTSEPEVWLLEHIGPQLEGVEVLVTPRLEGIQKKLEAQYPEGVWEWQETAPDPLHLAQRALEKFEKGECTTDGSVEIRYMR